jgi:hypothetical protein
VHLKGDDVTLQTCTVHSTYALRGRLQLALSVRECERSGSESELLDGGSGMIAERCKRGILHLSGERSKSTCQMGARGKAGALD